MGTGTKIEWCDDTWNIVTGCDVVSPGCKNCYAMTLAGGRLKHHPSRQGLTRASRAGPVWNGEVRFNEAWLTVPLRQRRPRRIFTSAHGDLFHEAVRRDWLDRIFAVIAAAPQHLFHVLTKRSERMRDYLSDEHLPGRIAEHAGRLCDDGDRIHDAILSGPWPLENLCAGVSVEDQFRANERIGDLVRTPCAVRSVSAEPLLGAIDFECISTSSTEVMNALSGERVNPRNARRGRNLPRLDQIIVGGESGPRARAMHPQWVRTIRDACQAHGTAFFFKQWGTWGAGEDPSIWIDRRGETAFEPHGEDPVGLVRASKERNGRLLDGRQWSEEPAGAP